MRNHDDNLVLSFYDAIDETIKPCFRSNIKTCMKLVDQDDRRNIAQCHKLCKQQLLALPSRQRLTILTNLSVEILYARPFKNVTGLVFPKRRSKYRFNNP